MKKFIISILACMSLFACQQEINLPEGDLYTASVENLSTKTSLSHDNMIYWSAEDEVLIFEKSTVSKRYKVIDETAGSTDCSLKYVQSSTNSKVDALNHNVALYPYSTSVLCQASENDSYVLSNVELQNIQSYAYESFATGSFPMIAVSTGTKLAFKNLCGTIMIQAKGNVKVTSVTIKGNKDEKLSGPATVTAFAGALPSIVMGDNAYKNVVLDCGEGVQLTENDVTEFILSVPPTDFPEGFKVVVKDTEDNEYVIETTKNNKVERSSILVMPEVTVEKAADIPSNGQVVIQHEGLQYVWDESVIPEITFSVTKSEWDRLLGLYDKNNKTKEYIHCDITYKKGAEETKITDAAIRLRGNTSRRRPEAYKNDGKHVTDGADWQHCHFGVNLRKFNKDKQHEIKGIRKFNLKWFKDDACYVREMFSYDLFRRAGIWTAAHDVYCRLWIHVEGDANPAYYGVYEMIEPYDNKYLEKREHLFGTSDGHLWKCSWAQEPADLSNHNATMAEDNDKDDFTYELKEYGDDSNFETAKAQLQDFMLKLNGKAHGTPGDSFYKWIKQVCDVDLLMRTYAVNVALGMWDDLWNNGNNYYLYFTTSDKYDYKFFLIPYDYDNTLGTSNAYDAAKQDPYKWGSRGVLISRMMEYEEFRTIYRDELKRLVDPANGLMDTEASVARIKAWQAKIQQYISNDTGEDMKIEDKPASWGSIGNYKLMSSSNNYFTVKAETINKMK